MSSYQRVTDTYVTVTALPISLQRFVPIQLQLESVLKWFKSQKAQLNLTKLAERKKGQHQKASTKKGTKYIRDILSQAEESSFRTRALRQTPLQHLQYLHNHLQHLITHLWPLNKHLW